MNRDSGTDSANGGWLRRLVRRLGRHSSLNKISADISRLRIKRNPNLLLNLSNRLAWSNAVLLLISIRNMTHDIRKNNSPMCWLWPLIGNKQTGM